MAWMATTRGWPSWKGAEAMKRPRISLPLALQRSTPSSLKRAPSVSRRGCRHQHGCVCRRFWPRQYFAIHLGHRCPGEPCASSTQTVRSLPASRKGSRFSRCTSSWGMGAASTACAFLKVPRTICTRRPSMCRGAWRLRKARTSASSCSSGWCGRKSPSQSTLASGRLMRQGRFGGSSSSASAAFVLQLSCAKTSSSSGQVRPRVGDGDEENRTMYRGRICAGDEMT
mmetsp:Transcript_89937/g.254742  ORF Transcript_89937/g.254742 Transcript_89937/m.254742 type:complete len:227 (-) Transcript_89937:1238-1918(-)